MRRFQSRGCNVVTSALISAVPSTKTSSSRLVSSNNGNDGSSSAIGKRLKDSGFTAPTPNFNIDFETVGEDQDVGEVEQVPAANCTLVDLHGPWLMITEGLQGELMIDLDGTVTFRPAGMLGQGIGRITLQGSEAMGMVMFKIDLEVYIYENTKSHPPNEPLAYNITGAVMDAVAKKANYTTRTLTGSTLIRSLHVPAEGGQSEKVHQFNAAKLSPWDASKETDWAPSEEIAEGYRMIFQDLDLKADSHLKRKASLDSDLAMKRKVQTRTANATHNLVGSDVIHMDLGRFKVGDIPDVFYIPNYVSEAEEKQMLSFIDATPEQLKTKMDKRTVQEWGCVMCPECNKSFVADYNFPPWCNEVSDMLVYDGIFSPSVFPNNVRIHEYERGEGIAPHVDGPIYVPLVAILSLASTSVMGFYPRREPYDDPMEHYKDTFKFDGEIAQHRPHMSVVMEPRSLLVFKGEAYSHYPHSVSDKDVDILTPEVAGKVVNRHLLSDPNMTEVRRQYRVGVTIRNLLPRCAHAPQRAEFNMKRALRHYTQYTLPKVASTPTSSTPSRSGDKPILPPSQVSNHQHGNKPTAATQPRSNNIATTTTSGGGVSHDELSALRQDILTILSQQRDIVQSLEDLKSVVAYNTTSTANFNKETSTVLNYMSQSILDVQSKVDDLTDAIEVLDGNKEL